jgi:hypothetical protein
MFKNMAINKRLTSEELMHFTNSTTAVEENESDDDQMIGASDDENEEPIMHYASPFATKANGDPQANGDFKPIMGPHNVNCVTNLDSMLMAQESFLSFNTLRQSPSNA